MVQIKRETRSAWVSSKVKPSTKDRVIKRCEELEITMSDYIDRLIKKDLK